MAEKELQIGNLDVRVTELEKELEDKDKVISDLQTDMGALTAIVYAMKEKLGDDFKSIDDDRINPGKGKHHPLNGSLTSANILTQHVMVHISRTHSLNLMQRWKDTMLLSQVKPGSRKQLSYEQFIKMLQTKK